MTYERTSPFAVAIAAALLSAGAAPLAGQGFVDTDESLVAGTHLGFGYVVNAPDQLIGFGLMTVGSKWAGWGVFADVKLTASRPSGEDHFTSDQTAADAEAMGDTPFGERMDDWTTVNVGVVRAVGHEVALYAGGGYARETVYQEYERQGDQGADRFYIVEDQRVSGNTVNLMGGLYFRATRTIMFQMGGETAPAGFTAGVSLVIPLGG